MIQHDFITAAAFIGIILLMLALADLLLKRLDVAAEATRRIVHILVGIMVAVAPFIFDSVLPVLTIAALFALLNYVAIRTHYLQGIHAAKRKSLGTVYFPISFGILSFWFWDRDPAIIITSMYIMALGDPIAGWVGESASKPIRFIIWKDVKSVQGSLAMFLVSYITVFTSMLIYRDIFGVPLQIASHAAASLFIAALATAAEAMSREGSDNLSVPLVSAFFMDILYNGSATQAQHLMLWIALTTLIAFLVFRLRFLSFSGTAAAWLLGSTVFGIGGLEWILPLAFFFITSSLLSKAGKSHKLMLHNDVYEKGDRRDFFQVFANGGIAMLMAVIHSFDPRPLWYFMYLASLGAATADTWATELGTFSRTDARHILSFNKVPRGRSGGISLPGTLGAFLAALSISLLGIFLLLTRNGPDLPFALLVSSVTAAGFFGSIVDSIAGATIQGQYRCPHCGKETEKRIHCRTAETQLVRGYPKVNNDLVNLLCTASAALVFFFVYSAFSFI